MSEKILRAGTGVSIFLPAYNERDNLERAVLALDAAAAAVTADYEIIIVEDGSTDGTAEVADDLSRRMNKVRVAHQAANAGYGAALLLGFAEAGKGVVFYTDADNQYDYSEFSRLFPQALECDVLIGYRRRRVDPVTRLFFAWAYGLFLKALFAFKWRDADCSFKFFRRSALEPITIESRSGFVEAELLLKCQIHGLEIRQVAVTHFGRPAGAVSFELFRFGEISLVKPGPIWAMIKDMVRCRLTLGRYARAVRGRSARKPEVV